MKRCQKLVGRQRKCSLLIGLGANLILDPFRGANDLDFPHEKKSYQQCTSGKLTKLVIFDESQPL